MKSLMIIISELLIYFMVKSTTYLYIYFKQKVNYKPIMLVLWAIWWNGIKMMPVYIFRHITGMEGEMGKLIAV